MLTQNTELHRAVTRLDIEHRDTKARMVSAILSTENPVQRGGYDEILIHSEEAVDMRRAHDGLPLLFGHDTDRPIGIVESVRLAEKKLRGTLRFGKSARASEVWEDVTGGVLKNISIGYQIHDAERDGSVLRAVRWECQRRSKLGPRRRSKKGPLVDAGYGVAGCPGSPLEGPALLRVAL